MPCHKGLQQSQPKRLILCAPARLGIKKRCMGANKGLPVGAWLESQTLTGSFVLGGS